jgi:hypothetical protein
MNALRKAEDGLARVWWLLLTTLLIFTLACSSGCRFSRVVPGPDGQPAIVAEGSDIIPAIPDAIEDAAGEGVVEDAVGAAVEAVEDADVGGAVQDASEGDWFSFAWKIAAFVTAIGGGYALRRKIRNRKVAT